MLKELSEDEFARRAKDADRVAVFKEFLADRETPVAALSRLGDDEEAFLLESVAGGETRGRYSYLGIEPSGRVEGDDALERLRELFAAKRYAPAPELPPLQGGAVGYVSYDAVSVFEPSVGLRREEGTPSMSFLLCDTMLVFDNVRDTVTVVVVTDVGGGVPASDAYAAAREKIDGVYERLLSAESIGRLVSRMRPRPRASVSRV